MSCPSTDFDNQSALSKMMGGKGMELFVYPLNYQNTLLWLSFHPFM